MNATVLQNCNVATMAPGGTPYGMIPDGAVILDGNTIAWVGSRDELPAAYEGSRYQDLQGRLLTPGLIDCHTHLVFGGNRALEFEMRLLGKSYEDIARSGGGILSTVQSTRDESQDQLLKSALGRVDVMIAEGVTTIEVKSGYGLTIDDEIKMLRVAREISRRRPVNIRTSWLAAHATPPEFQGKSEEYIDQVVIPGMAIARDEGLVDAVDAFCETIAFSPEQVDRLFETARGMGLAVKLHADQLSNLGGGGLAAAYQALSADHLEYLDIDGITAMKQAGTVAVLLPGACYTLRQSQKPPVDLLRQHDVPMAVATDCNPGSSPLHSILVAMNMVCTIFGLTPEEALAGATRNAAIALQEGKTRGVIAATMQADLAIWSADHPAELAYRIADRPLAGRILAGRKC